MNAESDPRESYRHGREEARRKSERLDRTILKVSRLRTGSFFLLVVPLLLLETSPREWWPPLLALAGIGAALFLFLVRSHRSHSRVLARTLLREQLNRDGEARLDRRWKELPPPPIDRAPTDHPSAGDLDLTGQASLSHLIGRVTTAPGKAFLRRFLLDPFAPLPRNGLELVGGPGPEGIVPAPGVEWTEVLEARQEAVRLLSGEGEFLLRLELLGREVEGEGNATDSRAFLEWAQAPGWLDERRGTVYLARFLALFTPLSLVGWFLGWTPGLLPALGALAALAQQRNVGRESAPRFSAAEGGEGDLSRWSALLEHAAALPTGSQRLDELSESVRVPAPGASDALLGLRRITDTAGVRRSALLHFPLVALCAWDVHVLDWLERWRARHGESVEGWIRSLGEMEAVGALAGLLHDHPDWTFPRFQEDAGAGLTARGLGHPLLRPELCVRNDVELPGPGNLLLVTGSNMAGKTTLLRTVGVNQVLALAGGPVAAVELLTRRILPWTSMRVQDDLEGGVSFFLAELHRLRRVVEAARERPVLYLLDEIFQGTNTAERRTAARIVLEQLLETGSLGAITTHDLTLADAKELRARSVDVHFREEVVEKDGHRTLNFDYHLRPGPATSRNALLLLEMVGLGPRNPEGQSVDREVPDQGPGP